MTEKAWAGKRVLVTGAGGFIGSHLTEALVREGAKTRAMVHYNAAGSWGWLDRSTIKGDIEVHAGDICDRDSIATAIEGVDIVFHLAALIAIPYSYSAPESYVRTNINGTLNVLQAEREHGVERLVHTSTSEVYGTARYAPIDEGHPLQGQSPYSATKIAADKLAESFHLSFDLPVVTVRPFNTFGPRQSARAVIPTIIEQCLRGNRVRLGNTAPTRDLNFVGNTVQGFLKGALAAGCSGQAVNLGSGKEISIGDLAKLIIDLVGKPVEVEVDKERLRPDKSEVGRLIADNLRAFEIIGWTPAVSLEEGLKRTIEWMGEYLDRYRGDTYVV